MDAYHRYVRPTQPQPPPPPPPPQPPSNSDHHHHLYIHQQRPPVLPQASWYSNQFQYHPPPPPQPPSSHSPSPPPPQQWAAAPPPTPPQQWAAAPPPTPPSSTYAPPPPPPHPYPSQHQFPPPPPPRPPPPHSQISQSYPQVNQEWGNSNWAQQPQQQQQAWSYDYQAHTNAEDWAAKARAWAAQKAAMEVQNPQSQFSQVDRSEEHTFFHDQYHQTSTSHYQDFQQHQFPASAYQQFPVSAAPPPVAYLQENASFSSGQSSNVPDGRTTYTAGGGIPAGAPTANPSVLQQEVPSSYSSIAVKDEATDQKDLLYKSLPLPIPSIHEGQHHMQPPLPVSGGAVLTEQPFAYGNQGADHTADLNDRPLDFAPGFTHDQDPHMQSSYPSHHDSAGNVRGLGPGTQLPSMNSWTSTGAAYPPIPPGLPSGHQHDPSVAIPSSVSGHPAPPFGSFPGQTFRPTIPAAGLSYGLGQGSALHPTTGFLGDAYGVSNVSERPKKASVPNWLKEEIIKNASAITRSSLEHPKEDAQSMEDEGVDRLYGKSDQADSRSADSSRSTEEEEEDEENEETTRTAAINQEIKRVLTEVLLKVTDELFDEIATKVLDEDDLSVEVEHNTGTANHKVSPSSEFPIPKASARVLVPVKEPEPEDVSEKSSSSAPGNVLGLANYASDDNDEDDEIKSSSVSNIRNNDVLQQSSPTKLLKDMRTVAENGSSPVELGNNGKQSLETDASKTSSVGSKNQINDSQKAAHTSNESGLRATLAENVADDSQDRETWMKSDEDSRHEKKRSYSGKDSKDIELGSSLDGNRRKQDDTHARKEKKDDRNGSKDKIKERGDRTGEKAKESESRKRSHLDAKEDRKESEKLYRSNAKDDENRKRDRTKDKEEDRARHRSTNDSSRHKRRRSSSTSSRGRNSKDRNSTDEGSDDSKRKTRSRKRNLSPSPVRSRRRQVSRSPHSKHSQRRHSPYSSLETTRRRRPRSKSPVRRHR